MRLGKLSNFNSNFSCSALFSFSLQYLVSGSLINTWLNQICFSHLCSLHVQFPFWIHSCRLNRITSLFPIIRLIVEIGWPDYPLNSIESQPHPQYELTPLESGIDVLGSPINSIVKLGGPGRIKTCLKLFGPVMVQPICLTGRLSYESRLRHIWTGQQPFISGPPVHGSCKFDLWTIHLQKN